LWATPSIYEETVTTWFDFMAGGYYRRLSLFNIDITLKFGPPFFVFLTRDLPSGISPLQDLQRRLHLPVVSPPHRHQEGKEQYPENDPEKPPISMHSPIVVHSRNLLIYLPKAEGASYCILLIPFFSIRKFVCFTLLFNLQVDLGWDDQDYKRVIASSLPTTKNSKKFWFHPLIVGG